MLLKELYQSMYGRINEVDDDDKVIKYKDKEGENKEMSAKAAKKMPSDHPAKIEYEKQKDDGGDKKKGVNIFDKPADEPKDKSKDKSNDPARKDDDRSIGGPNGLEIGRDEIKDILMNDPEMADILGDDDDVYWDDVDLVSSKHDDETVVSINPESSMSIAQLKAKILDFKDEKDSEGSDEDESDGSGMDAFFSGDSGAPDFEDLSQKIEDYDEDIEDYQYELDMARAAGDIEGENKARSALEDAQEKKKEAQAKLKAAQGKSSGGKYTLDDLRNKIEEYEEDLEEWEYELSMAQANGDVEGENEARSAMEDIEAKLKDAREKLANMGESARNIIPKGSLRRMQENWIKKNLL
tara:strand:- start:761 stop:1819 length:1059 start_codon:yes stop_codon:yes gene_type:complete